MQDLQGKAAVITGAGSGIGEGIAHAAAGAGMQVVVADIDLAAALLMEVASQGVGVSLLCPGMVNTNLITQSFAMRPAALDTHAQRYGLTSGRKV